MPLGQTITVVNKSGKIVSSSKQLVNVWKEAKAAYNERKAEIEAFRQEEFERKRAERRAQKYLDDDGVSRASSKRSKNPHKAKSVRHAERPTVDRGYTDTYYANDLEQTGGPRRRSSAHPTRVEEEEAAIRSRELTRRHTDGEQLARRHSEPHNDQVRRSSRRSSIDMDLAYGDLPPPMPQPKFQDDEELRGQMTKLTRLLDEANCLQYSVTTTVEQLQKNPDALAAVALTLAEISNLVTKMAPGALMALKGSFPAAAALLMSPQFLIAGGLAVGVTVVMLGGYKIIKRINQNKEAERQLETPMELQELEDVDLSRIELWRRGIADVAAESAGSTVDGEFITPGASRHLREEGVLPDDLKSTRSHKTSKSAHHKKSRAGDDTASKAGSTSSHRKDKEKDAKKAKKVKNPSPLRMLFQGTSTSIR